MLVLNAIWLVQPAGPIVSVFYCMSTSPEQQMTLMICAMVIWIVLLVIQLLFIKWVYAPVGQVLEKLENNQSCPDGEIVDAARRNSALAMQATIFYMLMIAAAGLSNFAVYLYYDIGMLSAMSIWGGLIAGGIACPFMVLGAVSLFTGPNTEFISGHLKTES